MIKLYDLAKVTTSAVGTSSPITLGTAVSGFLTFSAAGVQDGETVRYAIRDGANSEVGYGVYTASGTTLTRTVTSSTNSNAAISLSGSAQVFICSASDDVGTITLGLRPTPSTGRAGLFTLANVTPQMTSDSSGGATASASSFYTGINPFGAFTNNRTLYTGWVTNATSTGWIQIQLPAAKIVYCYGVVGWSIDSFPGRCPAAWTLQGSNNGSSWTTLDTRSGETNWKQWGEKFFQIASPASYLYYKMDITSNNGNSFVGLSNLILYGDVAAPTNGLAGLFMIIPNGDIHMVSRSSDMNGA